MIPKNLLILSTLESSSQQLLRKLCVLVLLGFFPLFSFSQGSSTAKVNASAVVIEPIRINKTVDLGFGNIISSPTPGTVTLSPDGNRIATGVQISASSPGTVNPGEAEILHGKNSYSLTLPEAVTLVNENNPDQIMVIDQFLVAPQRNATAEGTDIIKIGATLNLEANQRPGYYTNTAGFNVTVAYN